METTVTVPQYKRSKPQFAKLTSVTLTAIEAYYLPIIQKATGAPSTASALRLLLNTEYDAVKSGHRQQSDFILLDEPKTKTFTFKLSETEYFKLHELMSFYDAPTQSAVASHLIEHMIKALDTEEGGE